MGIPEKAISFVAVDLGSFSAMDTRLMEAIRRLANRWIL